MKEYKVLVMGDSGVGKTTFIRKLMNQPFRHEYYETFCSEKHSIINCNRKITLLDIPMQSYEQFGNSYMNDVDYAIVITDNRLNSRTSIKKYIYHLQKNNIPCSVVINKEDLIKSKDFVSHIRSSLPIGIQLTSLSCKNYNKTKVDNLFNIL